MITKVIIPAFNEGESVGKVIEAIPPELVQEVIVVNNASTDDTAEKAKLAGATVIDEPVRGYGRACLAGINYIHNQAIEPDIVVFMDADFSDYPEELPNILAPILNNSVDLVIGSRALGNREKGSMTPQQLFGNWLATKLLYWRFGAEFTDLGPFRAIRYSKLKELNMIDQDYGWTVEMQIKAAKKGLSFIEVPVKYRKRIGKSKVSGTIKGTIMAGYKILSTLFTYS